jgi:ATP-dependent protease HslVU (ClpYQ) peptidase subunit
MTTIVVTKKAGQVAIAADTLVTFGDTRLGHRFEANSKLLHVEGVGGVSYIGVAGSVAHVQQAAPGAQRELLFADQRRRQRPV